MDTNDAELMALSLVPLSHDEEPAALREDVQADRAATQFWGPAQLPADGIGFATSQPVLRHNPSSAQTDVFVRGKDLGYYRIVWNGSAWATAWTKITSPDWLAADAPAVAGGSDDNYFVAGRGWDHCFYFAQFAAGSTQQMYRIAPQGVAKQFKSAPAIAWAGNSTLWVFGRGFDDQIWYTSMTSSTTPFIDGYSPAAWQVLPGGPAIAGPTASTSRWDGSAMVAILGTDSRPYNYAIASPSSILGPGAMFADDADVHFTSAPTIYVATGRNYQPTIFAYARGVGGGNFGAWWAPKPSWSDWTPRTKIPFGAVLSTSWAGWDGDKHVSYWAYVDMASMVVARVGPQLPVDPS